LGSIYGGCLDVVSRRRVYMGIFLSLGLDALSLWLLDLSPHLRLVLAARKFLGGMEHSSQNHESAATVCLPPSAGFAGPNPGGEPQHGLFSCGRDAKSDSVPQRFRRLGSSARQCAQSRQDLSPGRDINSRSRDGPDSLGWVSGATAGGVAGFITSRRLDATKRSCNRWRESEGERAPIAFINSQLSRLASPVAQGLAGLGGGPGVPKACEA
jgi:hypothetical protein